MSFSETFSVLGLVAAGLLALAFAFGEPTLEQGADCGTCAAGEPVELTCCRGPERLAVQPIDCSPC